MQFPSNFHVITFPLFDLLNECLCMLDVAALFQPITRIKLAVGCDSRDVPPLELASERLRMAVIAVWSRAQRKWSEDQIIVEGKHDRILQRSRESGAGDV